MAIGDWTLLTPAHSPTARTAMGMAMDGSTGKVLMFGGYDGAATNSANAETWTWDGTDWTQEAPAHSPSARYFPTIGYHVPSFKVVLFGGQDHLGNGIRDTWTWDGTDWTQVFPGTGPTARFISQRQMAYNASINSEVFFGGFDGAYLQDTWRYDAGGWTQMFPAAKPSAREGGALVASFSNETLLFGGNDGVNQLADTWRFTGANWVPLAPAHAPSGRSLAGVCLFGGLGLVVLFGGETAGVVSNAETWSYDGLDWTHETPATTPPARFAHGMTYDNVRNQVVMFGGQRDIVPNILGDTWVLGPAPAPFQVAMAAGGVAPGAPVDRVAPALLQAPLPELVLTPGCKIELRSEDEVGNLRANDSWSDVALWVNDGS